MSDCRRIASRSKATVGVEQVSVAVCAALAPLFPIFSSTRRSNMRVLDQKERFGSAGGTPIASSHAGHGAQPTDPESGHSRLPTRNAPAAHPIAAGRRRRRAREPYGLARSGPSRHGAERRARINQRAPVVIALPGGGVAGGVERAVRATPCAAHSSARGWSSRHRAGPCAPRSGVPLDRGLAASSGARWPPLLSARAGVESGLARRCR